MSRDFYVQPGVMTAPGRHASLFEPLPQDVDALARVAHGLMIHEHITEPYGVTLTDDRRATVHIRPVERLVDRLIADDHAPLATTRPPEARLAGNCRHFTMLTVAMLRSKGVPARARCGFGGYFGTGWFEDHWVCEYWHAADARWRLADAQIDDVQRGLFRPDFDLYDVPRDRFLVAGDAWIRCRAGDADPAKFGLSLLHEAGLWWIAGNLVRDVAALANMEMLPWDVWGAMPHPDRPIDGDQLAFFDKLAALTQVPDDAFAGARASYADDDRLTVPATVYNAVLNRSDTV